MSTRLVLYFSLVANGVLLLIWLVLPKPQPMSQAEGTSDQPRAKKPLAIATKPERNGRPALVIPTFHWSQVASDDPAQLVANLRSIQCPDATIREVLMVLAFERFLPEIQSIAAEIKPNFYEVLGSSGGNLSELAKPQQEKLEKLDERARAFLQDCPKSDGSSSEAHLSQRASALNDVLPPEEAIRVVELEEYYSRMMNEANSLPNAERENRRAALKVEHREALRQFLAPDQVEELDYRNQGNLKQERPYFEATADEWKTIKEIQVRAKATNGAPETVQQEVAKFLGPERGEEFQQQSTSSYAELLELTIEAGLPKDVAKQAHEVRLAAEKARKEMAFDLVPGEYRIKWQEAWRQDTMSRLESLLGAEPYAAYMRSHHHWLKVQE